MTCCRGCVGKKWYRDRFLEGLRLDRDPNRRSEHSEYGSGGPKKFPVLCSGLVFTLVYGGAGVWLVATIAMVVHHGRGTGEGASGILKAFAWTAIPIVVLSFVSTAGAAVGEVSIAAYWFGFYLVWYVAAGVWLVATTAIVVLYARGERARASGILKSFAWTAIPIVTLSIVSTTGAAYGVSGAKFWQVFYFVWYVAAGTWLVATIAMVVLYARGKRGKRLSSPWWSWGWGPRGRHNWPRELRHDHGPVPIGRHASNA